MALHEMECEVCRAGAPTVSDDEIEGLQPEVPDWAIVDVDGMQHLRREFAFKDFDAALTFTNRVGAVAEMNGHHPAILTAWGKVTVEWWTHKIGGLHRTDFIMAAKTDKQFEQDR